MQACKIASAFLPKVEWVAVQTLAVGVALYRNLKKKCVLVEAAL